MKKILLISISPIHRDPRVLRQIHFLREFYELIVAGLTDPQLPGVKFIKISDKRPSKLAALVFDSVPTLVNDFESLYWKQEKIQKLKANLDQINEIDLIVANDADTLPLATYYARKLNCKLLVDLHEYAPRQFEDRLIWKVRFGRYFDGILKKYLPQADRVITVCSGISEELRKQYNVEASVITNAPWEEPLVPSPVEEDKIKIIHHGTASRSRKIETMIKMMDFLDSRFTLTFILVEGHPGYLDELKKISSGNPRIQFLDPVPTEQIASFINMFDIGLYILEPTNFNNKIALPNKFFEFIQARLCIAIGPSPEMAKITREHDLGIVVDDFGALTMAKELNKVTAESIAHFKQNSDSTAHILSADNNKKVFLQMVNEMI